MKGIGGERRVRLVMFLVTSRLPLRKELEECLRLERITSPERQNPPRVTSTNAPALWAGRAPSTIPRAQRRRSTVSGAVHAPDTINSRGSEPLSPAGTLDASARMLIRKQSAELPALRYASAFRTKRSRSTRAAAGSVRRRDGLRRSGGDIRRDGPQRASRSPAVSRRQQRPRCRAWTSIRSDSGGR